MRRRGAASEIRKQLKYGEFVDPHSILYYFAMTVKDIKKGEELTDNYESMEALNLISPIFGEVKKMTQWNYKSKL